MPYIAPAIILSLSAAVFDIFWMGRVSLIITYGIIIPILIIAFWLIVRWSIRREKIEEGEWLKTAGIITFLIVLFNAPGTLYFHEIAFQTQYDRFLHFACALVLAPLVLIWMLLLARIKGIEISKKSALRITFMLLFLGLFAWEGFQFLLDKTFGTKSFFDYAQPIAVDFMEDIVFGFVGMLIGLWYSGRSFDKLKV